MINEQETIDRINFAIIKAQENTRKELIEEFEKIIENQFTFTPEDKSTRGDIYRRINKQLQELKSSLSKEKK